MASAFERVNALVQALAVIRHGYDEHTYCPGSMCRLESLDPLLAGLLVRCPAFLLSLGDTTASFSAHVPGATTSPRLLTRLGCGGESPLGGVPLEGKNGGIDTIAF
jgi:hypothetical protein